jgi:hypothetical protein
MRCSWCGDYNNHNRRSCPHRSEESKKRDPPKRPKSCSWCGDTSHTRPKCEALKLAKETWIGQNAAYRARFLEDLKKLNFNYGAIFKYSTNDVLYLAVSVDWDSIKHDDRWGYPINSRYLSNIDKTMTSKFPSWIGLEEGFEKNNSLRYDRALVIESSTNEIPIENYIPGDWLSGVSGVEESFKK